MKILVIEDEVRLAEYLKKGLSESGYVVDLAHDGIDGFGQAEVLGGLVGPVADGMRVRRVTPVRFVPMTGRAQERTR